jgi:uncharacterized membrane protein
VQQLIVPGLRWLCAIGCGVPGGLHFAFLTFIMTSLGRIGQAPPGISATNAINVDVVRSLFMPSLHAGQLGSDLGYERSKFRRRQFS